VRAGEFLAAARALPMRTLPEVVGAGGALVIAPHPDDESLGCGGLICQATDLGIPLRVVFLSDGTGSHPNSKSHAPDTLRALRHEEGVRAGAQLGLKREHLSFLALPDRFVPTSGPLADWAVDEISALIDSTSTSVVFVTWDQDPHCDHVAAFLLARQAVQRFSRVRLYAYPTWAWVTARTPEIGYQPSGFRLPVSKYLTRKHAAIMEHESQTTDLIHDDPDAFRLPVAFLDTMLQPYEVYLKVPFS
jgi:LmbE family N-acetylglucosaminyl deacetylase